LEKRFSHLGIWIVDEDLKAINEVGSVEWITADADTQGLAKANLQIEDQNKKLYDECK
jgi:hypothetical protein